jgi:hypothetical protein
MNLPVDIVRLIKTFVRHDPKENMKLCLAAIGWDYGAYGRYWNEDTNGLNKRGMLHYARHWKKMQRFGVKFSVDIQTIQEFQVLFEEDLDPLLNEGAIGSAILKLGRMLRSQTYGV